MVLAMSGETQILMKGYGGYKMKTAKDERKERSVKIMEWWYVPMILGVGGFVCLLMIIIIHIIEDLR